MSGVFVCVVGPSGAGKDTLIDGARAHLALDQKFCFPRRIVTRESSSAEAHDTISREEFDDLRARNRFALSWSAHGLGYAIPGAVADDLAGDRVVVSNLSRAAIPHARRSFPSVRVVLVTAPTPVLRERLLARRRENATDVEARLVREAGTDQPESDLAIDNVGSVQTNVAKLVDFLRSTAINTGVRLVSSQSVAP